MEKRSIHIALLCLLVFCLPGIKILSAVAVVFIVAWFLITARWKPTIQNLVRNKMLWLPVCWLALHVIGISYSDNVDSALFDVQVKLSILLLPLLMVAYHPYSENEKKCITHWFALGLAITSVACLVRAALAFWGGRWVDVFYYKELSWFLHPTYFSLYLNLAIYLLWEWLWQDDSGRNETRAGHMLLIALFSIMVLLLNSKAGMLGWLLVMLWIVFRSFFTAQYRSGAMAIGMLIIFLLLVKYGLPEAQNRVKDFQTNVTGGQTEHQSTDSSNERIVIWQESLKAIAQSPLLGYGTGDVQDVLQQYYSADGAVSAGSLKLNPHNQYLQSWVALGLPGVLVLLSMMLFPFIYSVKRKYYAATIFLVLIGMNMMFESMLEVQSGVMFFAFFYTFFTSDFVSESVINENES